MSTSIKFTDLTLEIKTNFDFQDVVAQLQENTKNILCVRDNEYLSIFKTLEDLPRHLAYKTTYEAERGHTEYYFYCPSHGSEYVFFRQDAKKWLTTNYRESLDCETKNRTNNEFESESEPLEFTNYKTVLHNNRNMSTSSVLSAKRERNTNNILILNSDDSNSDDSNGNNSNKDDKDDETINEDDLKLDNKKQDRNKKSRTKRDGRDDFSTTETLGSIDFNDFNTEGKPLMLPEDNSNDSDDCDSSDLEETIAIPN